MSDINVYCGPMKCGKTEQILSEYKRQLIAGKKVLMFKPTIDTRFPGNVVVSRNGIDIPAILISDISQLREHEADVYCIDEFQFLDGDVNIILEMANHGKKFFISGLNLTAERRPFGKMPELLAISDNVTMLTAICDNCKNENAVFSYFKGGKDTEIVIGDKEYMSLCRKCFEEIIGDVKKLKNY